MDPETFYPSGLEGKQEEEEETFQTTRLPIHEVLVPIPIRKSSKGEVKYKHVSVNAGGEVKSRDNVKLLKDLTNEHGEVDIMSGISMLPDEDLMDVCSALPPTAVSVLGKRAATMEFACEKEVTKRARTRSAAREEEKKKPNDLDVLPAEALAHICTQMDNATLASFLKVSTRTNLTCRNIMTDRLAKLIKVKDLQDNTLFLIDGDAVMTVLLNRIDPDARPTIEDALMDMVRFIFKDSLRDEITTYYRKAPRTYNKWEQGLRTPKGKGRPVGYDTSVGTAVFNDSQDEEMWEAYHHRVQITQTNFFFSRDGDTRRKKVLTNYRNYLTVTGQREMRLMVVTSQATQNEWAPLTEQIDKTIITPLSKSKSEETGNVVLPTVKITKTTVMTAEDWLDLPFISFDGVHPPFSLAPRDPRKRVEDVSPSQLPYPLTIRDYLELEYVHFLYYFRSTYRNEKLPIPQWYKQMDNERRKSFDARIQAFKNRYISGSTENNVASTKLIVIPEIAQVYPDWAALNPGNRR